MDCRVLPRHHTTQMPYLLSADQQPSSTAKVSRLLVGMHSLEAVPGGIAMQWALVVQIGILAADVDVGVMPDNMLIVPGGGAAEEREHMCRPMVHPPAVSDSKVAAVVEAAAEQHKFSAVSHKHTCSRRTSTKTAVQMGQPENSPEDDSDSAIRQAFPVR